MSSTNSNTMLEKENLTFEITAAAKKKVFTLIGAGLVLLIFGIFGLSQGWFDPASAHHGAEHALTMEKGPLVAETDVAEHHVESLENEHTHGEHGHAEEAAAMHHTTHEATHEAVEQHAHAEAAHGEHGYSYWKRVKADLWHNNVYFFGIAIIGVFFMCLMKVAWAGWSAAIIRVFESFGYYLPVAGILLLVSFLWVQHDLFHWTHADLYEIGGAHYDKIIDGKGGFFFYPFAKGSIPVFFLARMIIFFSAWIYLFFSIRKLSLQEDLNGGREYYSKMHRLSAIFLVVFAVSSSIAAWDWIMSIDTHWFSTMFGWYVFASWLITGMCAITFTVVKLKEAGYLKLVNGEHLHDLGKFMFAFSIFWTYIWFSQFILYWYANIPEEVAYFYDRWYLNMGNYLPLFILNLIINFVFPFLFLMTRNAKRQTVLLKVAAVGLMIGHWLDFYLMIMPGAIQNHGGLNLGNLFVELGMFLVFLGIFVYSIMYGLSKAPLVAKNHPLLEESLHYHS